MHSEAAERRQNEYLDNDEIDKSNLNEIIFNDLFQNILPCQEIQYDNKEKKSR